MKKILVIALICLFACKEKEVPYNFETVFEASNGTETATYQETIMFYEKLANVYPEINIEAIGETDSGKPLHIVTLNPDLNFDFSKIRENKRILLINNGIHAGESDGIDATMMLFRDIVQDSIKTPRNTVLVTIPIYNIGGSLNRNATTRTNQNGPKEYGFRGNARNYDLNRDFIKCDTKNTKSFTKIFHLVQPDVFIDNHVSNGADYQYTLTHLFTQHNKLGGELGNFLHTTMMPHLKLKLSQKKWDISPFVNVYNQVPEKGFSQFIDYPRYSVGYTTLFNTLGLTVETHMLKPYKQRVEGTYELMKSMLEITEEQGKIISELRKNTSSQYKSGDAYIIDWEIDTTKADTLYFKGFEGNKIISDVTAFDRLKYDNTKPVTKKVIYQNYLKMKVETHIPEAYIIPQGWYHVIELLKLNRIEITQLERDSILFVENYKIENYQTKETPYEGHYQHYNTNITRNTDSIAFKKGDYVINSNQKGLRYIIETLEPQAPDSFFNWNFFDTILQQKEYFSAYVWEDKAKEMLDSDPELKLRFETKKYTDSSFANNWYAQLDWLHKKSVHYEKAHMQYPVYRLLTP